MVLILMFWFATSLLGLMLWSMARLRRGQLLCLVAGLTRRGMPLEPSLLAVGQMDSAEAKLARRVGWLLHGGVALPEALREVRAITRRQVVAVRVALQFGTAGDLLEALARQAIHFEQRAVRAGVAALYPILMAILLGVILLFVRTYIFPKFSMMVGEMSGTKGVAFANMGESSLVFIQALYVWGVVCFTLQASWFARWTWWYVPGLGEHLRMEEEAHWARHLALMLQSGATLEAALAETDREGGAGRLSGRVGRVCRDLENGVPPGEAFRAHGRWRPEFLWALDAVSQGAEPARTFAAVAEVLEQKAEERFNAILRICTPVAVLLSACGVGLLACTLFQWVIALSEVCLG
jgi:type II secretory pathway component PulF